ncbi:MAG TPA: STAS domain-containing protein [Micromonosporaceae bacterium]|nr:STAS domain-containing protein [Micromonosporaceae bacterium]
MGTDQQPETGPVPLVLERSCTGDGTVRLSVGGEVDMCTAAQLASALADALAEPQLAHLVVDLHRVSFLDSTGIATLLAALRQADGNSVGFAVVNCGDMVRRVLEITGVYKTLAGDAAG